MQPTENSLATIRFRNGVGLTNLSELYLDFGHTAHVAHEHQGVRHERTCFASCPEKVLVIRLAGDMPAFRFFKPLRGRLVAIENDLTQVWSVAAVSEGRLSVLVFNDGSASTEVPLEVGAPSGALFEGVTERRMVVIGGERGEGPPLKIEETPGAAAGTAWRGRVSLGAKQGAMYVFRLGPAASGATRERRLVRRQFVADAVLQKLDKGEVELKVGLPASAPAAATRAYLRLVTEATGELSVAINGQTVFSGKPDTLIRDVSVPLSLLKADNTVRFRSSSPQGAVLTASIWLEAVD